MERWSSRLGFLLAAIGSAVGIGNIWRFPSVVGANGGGAYLLPYLIAVFLFAVPMMILELAMGRQFRGSVVSAFRQVRARFHVLGWLIAGIVFLILSYYLVVTGWTLAYFTFALLDIPLSFSAFTSSSLPPGFFVIAALTVGLIVSLGVRQGIERITTVLMPLVFVILIGMALFAATLPGFSAGLAFFLTPDYSVLTNPLLWSAAFGQAFFSLSVGQGILLTYGMYVESGINIPRSSLIITLADLSVALLGGLVIFPIVFTFGLEPAIGAELAFSTLPRAFELLPGGRWIAVSFFVLLFFAALTSAISMLEVSVTPLMDSTGLSRGRVSAVLTALVILVGLPSALSYTPLQLTLFGARILDIMDETVGTLGLPVTAVLTAVVFTWFLGREVLEVQLAGSGNLARWVYPMVKYVIPAVLVVTTAARLLLTTSLGWELVPGLPFIGDLAQGLGTLLILSALLALILIACRLRSCRLPGLRYFR
ncbi:MAG: sodium-dependent transporter [Methanomicrobiales archaeon]|nr:sodium-dependent transporter [Methanomicrobiales archaeon]MDI6876606.1 sodium-dependent transporter [Methanomicrobiales archaeon]